MIDSYHDRRTGFEFAVNPAGVKSDYAIYGDDQQEDDAGMRVEVVEQADLLGWTTAIALHFDDMPSAAPSGFAVGTSTVTAASAAPPSSTGVVSQLGIWSGSMVCSTAPAFCYAVVKNVPAPGFERDQQYTAGADIKYGITSNITVDATVNPDFGQVEADPSVVNLSLFETFFQERRPFFVEGTGIFNFGVNCNIVNCQGEGLFYSRRIGHDLSRILGAAKITGRLPAV